jgi:arylsulfatase
MSRASTEGCKGAYRVPALVRWPGKIKPDQVSNEIMSHLDWMPTLLDIAGDTGIKDKLERFHVSSVVSKGSCQLAD